MADRRTDEEPARTDAPRAGAARAAKGALDAAVAASPDLRAAALLAPSGGQLASSDGADWAPGVAALWEAADRADGAPVTQVHIGTEQGEVFAVRRRGACAVAVSDRFALASLMFCDLRALLRDLEPEPS